MTVLKTVTQGGQVHLHQLRMLKQVCIAGGLGAFIAAGGYMAWQCQKVPHYAWQMAYETYWAKFMFVTTPDTKHKDLFQVYTPPKGKPYKRTCQNVLNDPLLKKTTKRVETYLLKAVFKSLQFGGVSFLLIMVLWYIFGRLQKRPEHKRGNSLVSWKELKNILRKRGEASDLHFGKLPLMKNKETSHTLITGTTGSGKTNAFHILIPQIRKRGNRAIVLDVTGDFISLYYDEERDKILNPLDQRSEAWHPWGDCHLDSHYDVFAEAMIQPKEGSGDPFWDNASRAILKTSLRKFAAQGNTNIEELYDFLMTAPDKEFEYFFRNTEAASFAFKNNEKTTHSIRSVLSSQIEGLRQLEATETPFSIRNWVSKEQDGGFLFITARPDQRKALKPLISAWMDIAFNAIMILPKDQTRRLWFIMDELSALQKLPSLETGLAESRKYGGCFLAGFQSKSQIEKIYGRHGADTMLDLFNTKIFFRSKEPNTQQWISKVLGDKEEAEPQENISFGAHHMRDGVSLTRHTHQKPIVMPTEISLLNDLECYIRFPGDIPCTQLQTPLQAYTAFETEAFLLKPEKKRKYIYFHNEEHPLDVDEEEVS